MAKKINLKNLKKYRRFFFGTERGNEPVAMPLCRSLGGGLWEVRTALEKGRIARVIFFFCNDELIALNGFIKKTQKTPKQELDLAAKRKKEYEQ